MISSHKSHTRLITVLDVFLTLLGVGLGLYILLANSVPKPWLLGPVFIVLVGLVNLRGDLGRGRVEIHAE